jgi:hypothetical protein
MNHNGIALCTRFGYPPNSLSLCGPEKQSYLSHYAATQTNDKGTIEILKEFQTLYPYLVLIAKENNIRDPFDPKVVKAYWIGNTLLKNISPRAFSYHLLDSLMLKKKLPHNKATPIVEKLDHGLLPHHNFHVLNVYHRTGNIDENHTIATMDACIIHSGTVIKILPKSVVVKTNPLMIQNDQLILGTEILRSIEPIDKKDTIFSSIKIGDTVAYHWGLLVTKLTKIDTIHLHHYTEQAIRLVNRTPNTLCI